MTTTKKKAKRKGFPYKDALERLIQKSRLGARRTTELETTCVALSDRLTALAAQVNEVISGMQGFDMRLTGTRERLTALEQAQRPAEKPATEKRAVPWVAAAVLHAREDDRLRDAVVEAALAWTTSLIDPRVEAAGGAMTTTSIGVVTAKDRQCGCFIGVVMDLPGEEKVTARTVAKWIRDGRMVGRCAVEDLRSGSVVIGHTCEKRVTP